MLIVFFIFIFRVRCLVNLVFTTGYENVAVCITYMGLPFTSFPCPVESVYRGTYLSRVSFFALIAWNERIIGR